MKIQSNFYRDLGLPKYLKNATGKSRSKSTLLGKTVSVEKLDMLNLKAFFNWSEIVVKPRKPGKQTKTTTTDHHYSKTNSSRSCKENDRLKVDWLKTWVEEAFWPLLAES